MTDQPDTDRRRVLAATAATAAATVAPTAAAQSDDETDESATQTATAGNATTVPSQRERAEQAAEQAESAVETEQGPTYLARLSDDVRVLDYDVAASKTLSDENVQKSTVTATLETDRPVAVTKTDAFAAFASRGVSSIPERSEAVAEGRQRVSMDCTVVRGTVGMGLATDEGGVGISSGVPAGGGQSVGLVEGTLAGLGTGVIGTALAAWRRQRDDLQEPEDVGDERNNGGLL